MKNSNSLKLRSMRKSQQSRHMLPECTGKTHQKGCKLLLLVSEIIEHMVFLCNVIELYKQLISIFE